MKTTMEHFIRYGAVLLTWFYTYSAFGQAITWTRIAPDLPSSVRAYEGIAAGPIYAWYAEIDYSDTLLKAKAILTNAAGGTERISSIAKRESAYVAVNGGFFGGGQSYSLVVSDGALAAKQIAAVTRTAGSYPLMRANIGVMKDRSFQSAWIYHFGNALTDLYRFAAPLPHTGTTIAPAPVQQDGTPWTNVYNAIGGGPNLVSAGQSNVTYDPEVMFGSGVGKDNGDPRTAVGFTANKKIILFEVDGRSHGLGLSLPQMADAMIQLGCIEAVNLDGGGSSTFYAGGAVRNSPSDGSERSVVSAFAIVPLPSYDRVIDTDDPGYRETGSGWFASANPGYVGTQPARLVPTGNGDLRATFRFSVPKRSAYELSAWWVASSNRATNTPIIVYSEGRADTLRVNQTVSGSAWNKLGTFTFGGSSADSVVVTNDAVGGTSPAYIVTDGLRLVSYDRALLTSIRESREQLPSHVELHPNYPNPFNPRTRISFDLPLASQVEVKVYDLLGRETATLFSGQLGAGSHHVMWDAAGSASGIYFCRLKAGDFVAYRKMVLVR